MFKNDTTSPPTPPRKKPLKNKRGRKQPLGPSGPIVFKPSYWLRRLIVFGGLGGVILTAVAWQGYEAYQSQLGRVLFQSRHKMVVDLMDVEKQDVIGSSPANSDDWQTT